MRPRDRADCRVRIGRTKLSGKTAEVRFPQDIATKEPTSLPHANQIIPSDSIRSGEIGGETSDPAPSTLPLDTIIPQYQAFAWPWSTPHDVEHDASGTAADNLFGDLASDQYQPGPSDYPAFLYGSDTEGLTLTTSPVLSPGLQPTGTSSGSSGSAGIEERNDQNSNYCPGFGDDMIGISLHPTLSNPTDAYGLGEALNLASDISDEAESSAIETAPREPQIVSYDTELFLNHLQSERFSVPSEEVREVQTEAAARAPTGLQTSPYSDTIVQDLWRRRQNLESPNAHFSPDLVTNGVARISRIPSLGSLRKRLSYSSSQMSDILTLFKRCSVSTRGTKQTSSTISTLGAPEGIVESERQETTSDTMYETECSTSPAPNVFPFATDRPTISSRCSKCFLVHDSSFGSCDHVPFEFYVGSYHNTALHVSPALNRYNDCLFELGEATRNLNAVNAAGQTFLHVIKDDYMLRLEGELPKFLLHISGLNFDFGKVDCQGVNVLQALLHHSLHHDTIVKILKTLNISQSRLTSKDSFKRKWKISRSLMTSRDSFGRTCYSRLRYLQGEAKKQDPQRYKVLSDLLSKLRIQLHLKSLDKVSNRELLKSISDHAPEQSEAVLNQFVIKPDSEDAYGRNGLHYLAVARSIVPRATTKNKRESALPHKGQARPEYLVKLIDAGVNVNSYDKAGNTPLHAFLCSDHLSAEGYKHDETVAFYLTRLVKAGALVDHRNRDGESPLHVAIKLGNIPATQALISLGANIHARQKDGKGVVRLGLEVAQSIKNSRKKQKSLHLRIMACVDKARSHGAVEYPISLQEWNASTNPEAGDQYHIFGSRT